MATLKKDIADQIFDLHLASKYLFIRSDNDRVDYQTFLSYFHRLRVLLECLTDSGFNGSIV